MKRREIEQRFDAIVEFSGVERFIDTPVKRYSSGMYVRLAFSVAAHLEPEILLVDEVLAVGDAEFQRRCLGRMEEFGSSGSDGPLRLAQLPAVAQLCDRAIHIESGRVVEDGPPADVIAALPPSDPQRRSSSGRGPKTTRPGRRPREDPRRPARPARRDAAGRRRRAPARSASRSRSGSSGTGKPVFPKIKVLDREGAIAFNAMDTNERWLRPDAARRVRGDRVDTRATSSTRAPSIVEAAICSIDFPKLDHHAAVYEAISFEVLDPGEGDSARGTFGGQWRGVVRPLLDWSVEAGPLRR